MVSIPFNRLAIRDATYARDQFIALGVGAIVGRCGGSSPASALAPCSLSLLGREWVVFPARVVVVELKRAALRSRPEYVAISASPTLGLVCDPTIVSFGQAHGRVRCFYHWAGPLSCGRRFALVMAEEPPGSGRLGLCVIDTLCGPGDGEAEVKSIGRLSRPWCSNRQWVAAARNALPTSTLSLWSLGDVVGGREGMLVANSSVEGVVLPWAVDWISFCGDSSLVVAQEDSGPLVVDLEATLAQGRLVSSPLSLPAFDGSMFLHDFVCWEGMAHAVLYQNEGLLCLSTGQRTPLRPGVAHPIGGKYAAKCTYSDDECITEVYSVFEPERVCFTHRALRQSERLRFGHETVLMDNVVSGSQGINTIKVVDAVSGFLMCKMVVKGFSVTDIS
ncbi:hypothetical protein Pelo_15303 [Pelomyxa schiedti]|nr:hypothetical protein Pelo_15303 [Pelomyxa schiedti]